MFARAPISMKLFYMSTDYTASNIIPLPLIRTGQGLTCTVALKIDLGKLFEFNIMRSS